MKVYREDPTPPEQPSDTVEVSVRRFKYLERCELILSILDYDTVYVDVAMAAGRRRRHNRCTVAIETGEAVDMYPVWLEGCGETLSDAVEDALELPPVQVELEPEVANRGVAGVAGFLLGCAVCVVGFLVFG